MLIEIPLALAASLFTASASIALRAAAAPAPGELRFSWRLVAFLLRRPLWFFGVLFMIAGFLFQVTALHYGELAVVQPVIASELIIVFAYLALRDRARVRTRDWVAAAGMAVSLGGFLYVANPSGGASTNAGLAQWLEAAGAVALASGVAVGLSVVRGRGRREPTPARKAAFLAISAAVTWGFVAAVVKELSVHIAQGPTAVLGNWSPYALLVSGAIGMFLVSNAFQAGPLAASQPYLTIVDPLVASLLGITIFGEHIRSGAVQLVAEAFLLAVLVGSVVLLSRSHIVQFDDSRARNPRRDPAGSRARAHDVRAEDPDRERGEAAGADKEPTCVEAGPSRSGPGQH
ncbi:MAG TPA: DMT family transporter [Acidimicrobiales bacterium]|nr:DMT family transporter [Acidimicrobiales bacterium]